MFKEIKNIKSEKSDLRKFGITVGIVFVFIGGFLLWREKSYYLLIFAFSAFFILAALILPIILKPIQKIWMTAAIILGWFVTRIILTVLYYFIVTPIGLILRFSGKEFLSRKIIKNTATYWILKPDEIKPKHFYEKQY